MRSLSILALAAFVAPAFAQDLSDAVDQTPDGGMEEVAARYYAAPPEEAVPPAVDETALSQASEVDLAMAVGAVETGLEACQDLRTDMEGLIGDAPGAYSINPGWLRAYQSCLLRRAEETSLIGDAIKRRRFEVIGDVGDSGGDTEEAALRAADQLSRLSARQSELSLAVQREARVQRGFVEYYNTGEKPVRSGGGAVAPASTPTAQPIEPAPMGEPTAPAQLPPEAEPAPEPGTLDGALIVPDEMTEPMPGQDAEPVPEPGTPPFDPAPAEPEASDLPSVPDASGGPMPLRGE